ncbi:MAG TPA: Tm-1-like ATP-binding domain-containing protein [Solirubrobacteraceae bacterium]
MIGTLDTKGEEIGFLADAIVEAGGMPILLDSSVSGRPAESGFPLISSAQVARASGTTLEEIAELPRGEAVEKMRDGVRETTEALVASGRADGAICIGGAGAHVAGPAFQALPVGFPKLVVTPLASGRRQFEPYVGVRDVAVMHSVADIAGLNEITEKVCRTAAGYIVGAARMCVAGAVQPVDGRSRPTVAVSMNGNTTTAMDHGRLRLEAEGYAVVTFHANGVGGRALEDLVSAGRAAAVLDFTTTELGAGLVGGLMQTTPTRMEGAGKLGIPQVLVPGCVDFITAGNWEDAEREFPGRTMFHHNPELTLVRLTAAEMAELGSIFAKKANGARGPTSILIPSGGFSIPDSPGGPFWDPEADGAFIESLQRDTRPDVKVEVLPAHINDGVFADTAVEELLALIHETRSHATPAIDGAAQQERA